MSGPGATMTEIDPYRFIWRCLFEPAQNGMLRQFGRWLRGERSPLL